MDLKEIIRDYKNKTGCNDSEIARRLGLSRSTTSRWASGQIKRVSPDIMVKLSELVGYNVEPVLKGMDISVKLPVLGFVKGGYDLFAEENYIGEEDASLSDCKSGDYYLQVTGNSMNGVGIMDGSLVLVQQTDHISSGEIGVVLIDQEVTVKKVVLKKNMMILEAANPDVENRYFTSDEIQNTPVRVIGRVISCKTYF
ncbi:MAG: helix-turn-helix domain-containing protein [Solobacterium sp.]|nr:helix-turn-helix domain-containing protein [Solobacterium sp.]MBQ9825283.1 helix-turn-helix domain-containing protein [Solobacterium sp.]